MWSFLYRWIVSYSPTYSAHRALGPSNVLNPNYERIATLSGVPAGDYVVVAKVQLEMNSNFGSDVQLQSSAAGVLDFTNQTCVVVGASARIVHNLEAAVTLSKTTDLWLEGRCAQAWTARQTKIVAIRVSMAADAEVTS